MVLAQLKALNYQSNYEATSLHRLLATELVSARVSKCLRADEDIEKRLSELCITICDTLKTDAASACIIVNGGKRYGSYCCDTVETKEKEFIDSHDFFRKFASISESGAFIDDFSTFARIYAINAGAPRSLAVVGLFVDDELCGFISAVDFSPGRKWNSQDEKILLHTAEEMKLARVSHITLTRLKEAKVTATQKAVELEKLLNKEKELNALQADFIATASHEFKTPLAIIDAAAQLLKSSNTADAEYLNKQLEKIRSAVKRMGYLVEKTLELSAAEAEKVKCQPKPLEISGLTSEIAARFADVYFGRKIALCSNHTETWALADEKMLDQVLTNAIGNALKYSPEGSDIQVKIAKESQSVAIYISDHGIGIHPEDLGRMFSKFARGRNTSHTAGSGIGLYICDRYIRMMSGNLFIASELDEGTVVKIVLPAAVPNIKI